ncbi:hypothetical protein ABEV55_15720 [Aneurinibacillus thermoaerophilus]|uniref:hypothetical protein n=1 Tax=Aneurinibacillus TaxID=55079 RepID=UPI000708F3E0|nr:MULTISPECIES: hypothetical protein [Aneurinibacillus]AMA72736.1 hypothetical protein ACH33_07640 [Aneurinibacillus sp. XH2]MED0675832.1 hypothetical protein [Aneurinibacillus thermoaerophilus]
MKQQKYTIDNSVFQRYLQIHKDFVEQMILSDLKKSPNIQIDDEIIYLVFGRERCIIYRLDNKTCTVHHVAPFSYELLLPDELLQSFKQVFESLPLRLQHWANEQYFYMIKKEIIESLISGRITFTYEKNNSEIIGKWKSYDLNFKLTKEFVFEKVELKV